MVCPAICWTVTNFPSRIAGAVRCSRLDGVSEATQCRGMDEAQIAMFELFFDGERPRSEWAAPRCAEGTWRV
jgi:hypothetical protein